MQTTTQDRPRQRGLFRRFFRQEELYPIEDLSPSVFDREQPDIIDIRPIAEPDLQTLYFRLEKLESGLRLMVETMKRTYGDLASSVAALARQLDLADARAIVERIVAEETAPLATSIRALTDTVQRFPHVLAAAMDDIGLRIDSGRWEMERALGENLDSLRQLASETLDPANGTADGPAPLAPRPFDLEPIEQQFGGAEGTVEGTG